jgi:hypothetical protein
MKDIMETSICIWIGEGEGCREPTILGKSYCERHHTRMYIVLLPEMAEYMIEKELKSIDQDTD